MRDAVARPLKNAAILRGPVGALAIAGLLAWCAAAGCRNPSPPAAAPNGQGPHVGDGARHGAGAEARAKREAGDARKAPPPLIDIPNVRVHRGVLAGGQPTPAQLQQARDAGYRTIVNTRGPGEPMTDVEPALVAELGMTYVSIPMPRGAGLTRANAEALDRVLATAEGPIMVHCASGNRVGGLFALRAFWIEGKTRQQALAEGARAGMTRIASAVRDAMARSASDPE